MSSRNRASKGSHLHYKTKSSVASKEPNHPSTSHSSSSQTPHNRTSSSMNSDCTPPRISPQLSSNSSTSTSNTSRSSNTESFDDLAHAHIDLISISAWTSLHESSHHHQVFPYQSDDSLQSSTCPYHISMRGSEDQVASPRYGLLPLERWLSENLKDGGSLTLQLGRSPRLECTCITMQNDIVHADGDMNGA
ncbi:hypothetical protein BDZ45DRAFT_740284 [Acephala macrosclerotiorum]|nr:hypothetical protein BDZ45DRAFT_740284 [Acephala macrosclerotiorum]